MSQELAGFKDLKISEVSTQNKSSDEVVLKGKSGIPNQSMTKPITVDSNTGEVIVKKFTGKQRIRKGQSLEQYEEQLQHFYDVEKGPTVTPIGWLASNEKFQSSLDTLDLEVKHNRLLLMGFIHRWYYNRDYSLCLKACNEIQQKYKTIKYSEKKMKREIDELKYVMEKCSTFIKNGSN
ncbi:similar to Saccharomyces cerevisiae YPL108W Cytoplasmic protein of unknown function [Maudiozyma barnettii]|uniref:Uncharacterized protein n=1 Tax=Maudiozyma barnettii TaxID=61262 RepID=A0A8H2VHY3_9SACH|nr:hypothetical protein [Kazachstania barnettii]CAB4255781.1 similar to Saccharomyces cerevisiae YPL108W Cytoplasmic protein of unknown function [Kazachstania barnettii]CAD1784342.1 similar to Saccharomyces cerevisiae YPL108W Cytoplasmic protein of unknown function [Kazachstania barnettii]